jgi:membrane-bound ClpP family serine protease
VLHKPNFKLIGVILLSLADEAVIFIVAFIILSVLGVHIPVWAIITSIVVVGGITYAIYVFLRRQPQLGFENMIGLSGITVEPVGRKGTIRIKGELWSAVTEGPKIEVGNIVKVIQQTGLQLTVIPLEKNEAQKSNVVLVPQHPKS